MTMGREVTRIAHEWYSAGKYQDYLYLHGLGVESAEALGQTSVSVDDRDAVRGLGSVA